MSIRFGASINRGAGCLDGLSEVAIGHASVADTGVTVIATPKGAVAAVDVRGGGPGTRETDLLSPENTVEKVHSIVLAGGSAFGLAAADGVMRELARRGIGFEVTPDFPDVLVPIVPGAVIFDLLLGSKDVPDAALGAQAVAAALDQLDDESVNATPATSVPSGCVGAGTGAMAGAIKGGFGQACVALPGGYFVAAVMVANPMGAVVGPDGRLYGDSTQPAVPEQAMAELAKRFVGMTKVPVPKESTTHDGADKAASSASTRNTTIGCLITNAPVTQAQAQRLAMCGHDGLARAIRPAHAPMDGDTLFCVSIGGNDSAALSVDSTELAMLTVAASDAVENAIVDAVLSAEGRAGVPAWKDLVGDPQ
ncbi:P1 family peptidase [Corynebacterium sp. H113]|uniref:P1 family peptidase n=1 Tax=Corynebacterium sp. H113 TaxID=3133419 RepID=UPI003094C3BF